MSTVTYNTKQKKLILDLMIKEKNRQLSCDEITYILLNQNTPVGKTTVYRQLEKLVADGVIKKTNVHNSKSFLYQYIDRELNCDAHLHLRCTNCGKYIHLGCDFMNKVNEHISEHHDFIVDNSNTEILGVCGGCLKEEKGGLKCR